MPTKININFYDSLIIICMQKKQLHPSFFEILQRYYKLTILGTLDMPVHTHQKQ